MGGDPRRRRCSGIVFYLLIRVAERLVLRGRAPAPTLAVTDPTTAARSPPA